MTVGGLRAGINGSLIERLSAYSGSAAAGPGQAFSGGAATTGIKAGLRTGARAFSNAVQNLNNVISVVNISSNVLTELGEITDKLIDLTEKATKSNVGQQSRRRLNTEFQKLAGEFKKIIKDADLGQFNVTTREGLAELFTSIGLDKDNSSSIAEVFSKFILSEKDDFLASQKVKGVRPINIPSDALGGGPAPVDEYKLRQIATGVESGFISSAGSYFQTDNHSLIQGDDQTLITQRLDGTYSNMLETQFAGDIELVSVNQNTGYGVVKHKEGDIENLYLVDSTGKLVMQMTDLAAGEEIQAVDMSDDNQIAFLIRSTSAGNVREALLHSKFEEGSGTYLTSTLQANIYTDLDVNPIKLSGAKISASGALALTQAKRDSEADYQYYLASTVTTARETLPRRGSEIQFVGEEVLYSRLNPVTNNYEVFQYTPFDVGSIKLLHSAGSNSISNLQALKTESGDIHFAFYTRADDEVSLYKVNSLGGSDLVLTATMEDLNMMPEGISQLSIAENSKTGRIDLGVRGSNDDGEHFSRYEGSSLAETGPTLSGTTIEYEKIFDRPKGISNRPDAHRMLVDLKALKEQIDSNIEALEFAHKTLEDNLELVRAAGLAFLELSDGLKTFNSAAEAAQEVRSMIRGRGRSAALQAENLENLAITALFLEDKN